MQSERSKPVPVLVDVTAHCVLSSADRRLDRACYFDRGAVRYRKKLEEFDDGGGDDVLGGAVIGELFGVIYTEIEYVMGEETDV